jgi:hypothetical protein
MFTPIIHNLDSTDTGFKEVQYYNKLIGERPSAGMTSLKEKIETVSAWRTACRKALVAAEQAVGVKTVPANDIVGFLTLDVRA